MGDSDIGDTLTTNGVPGNFYIQKLFWVIIGSAIAFATVMNVINQLIAWQRLRSSSAKPRSSPWAAYATATAISREITYFSLGSIVVGNKKLRFQTLGNASLILLYFTVIIVLCFYKYDTEDQWSWEPIAYRIGCIAQTQLPLVYLLAAKQNIVGLVTGVGYERLSWIHRWISRIVWLTVTLHMAFWFRSWARYDYIKIKLMTDSLTQTGFAAWVILTIIVIIAVAPIRRWNYEIFVLSHIILVAGFTCTVYIHIDDGKKYVWTCVAIWVFDRFLRTTRTIYLNLSIFNWSKSKPLWSNKATLTPLPGNATRITIDAPVFAWKAGQHIFLSCHSVLPLQSHPFTIASLPSDKKMEFLIRSRGNGTKKFHICSSKYQLLPSSENERTRKKSVVIEGPYGRIRSLQQFDSVVFFAGGTGATFTTPLLRDVVRRWFINNQVVTKRIRFVWAIKSRDHLIWFRDQLERVMKHAAESRRIDLEVDISIYVTCIEALELGSLSAGLSCSPPNFVHADRAEVSTRLSSSLATDEEKFLIKTTSNNSSSTGDDSKLDNNDTCCCNSPIINEDTAHNISCCCKPTILSFSSPLKILTGRPHPRSIIRKMLEEAEGESAVVVCGPRGLQDAVRDSVLALSDERAVHKGTGAQGVWLHVEGFCY